MVEIKVGIFLSLIFDLQGLDSYKNPTSVNGQAGSAYLHHALLVNVSKPSGIVTRFSSAFQT